MWVVEKAVHFNSSQPQQIKSNQNLSYVYKKRPKLINNFSILLATSSSYTESPLSDAWWPTIFYWVQQPTLVFGIIFNETFFYFVKLKIFKDI